MLHPDVRYATMNSFLEERKARALKVCHQQDCLTRRSRAESRLGRLLRRRRERQTKTTEVMRPAYGRL
jgi:hypothetical protein